MKASLSLAFTRWILYARDGNRWTRHWTQWTNTWVDGEWVRPDGYDSGVELDLHNAAPAAQPFGSLVSIKSVPQGTRIYSMPSIVQPMNGQITTIAQLAACHECAQADLASDNGCPFPRHTRDVEEDAAAGAIIDEAVLLVHVPIRNDADVLVLRHVVLLGVVTRWKHWIESVARFDKHLIGRGYAW